MAIVIKEKAPKKDEFTELFFSTMTTGLSEVLKTVKESRNYYFNLGIEDELAQVIGKLIEDPLSVVSEHYDKQVEAISNLLAHGVEKFIGTNKKLVYSAYKTNDGENELYYSIVLNSDDIKNRQVFFDFLNEYDSRPIAKHFPIHFEFVPQKREKHIRQLKKVNIGFNEKPSEQSRV